MKLFTLPILCCFVAVTSGMSQSFDISPSNSITITAPCATSPYASTVYIKNHTSADLYLSYTVDVNTLPGTSCWDYMFCDWNQCILSLPSGTNHPPIPILANDSGSMILDFTTGNNQGQGSYALTIFDSNNASDFKTLTWNVTGCSTGANCASGVAEIINNNLIAISPNPAQDFISVELVNGKNSHGSLGVYTLVGKKLMEYRDVTSQTLKIDLAKLPAGGYFIKYNSEAGVSFKKFIKTN